MDSVEVRPRTSEDLGAVSVALGEVHARDGYPMVWPEDPQAWLSPPGMDVAWLAVQHGEVLGHLGVIPAVTDPAVTERTGPRARLARVTRLFVAPAARDRGLSLGTWLLETATGWAGENGYRLMLDVVDDGGPAVALYRRLGWELVDRRTADWLTPDGRCLSVRIYLAPAQASRRVRKAVSSSSSVRAGPARGTESRA